MACSFINAKFITSVADTKNKPFLLNEITFVGKSNVGKSSLINALCNMKRLAFTSSKPGMTRLLNYYEVKASNKDKNFYIVDCPGYGYSAKKGKDYLAYGNLVEDYFKDNKLLKLVIFLLDSRRVPSLEDIDFFNYLKESNYNFIICFTKCDKLNQSEKSKIKRNYQTAFNEDFSTRNNLLVSINDKISLDKLRDTIVSYVY